MNVAGAQLMYKAKVGGGGGSRRGGDVDEEERGGGGGGGGGSLAREVKRLVAVDVSVLWLVSSVSGAWQGGDTHRQPPPPSYPSVSGSGCWWW